MRIREAAGAGGRTKPTGKPGDRSVADRVLSVLGAFDRGRPALTLTDISRRAGLPLATTHRSIAKSPAWGALERDAAGESTMICVSRSRGRLALDL